MKAMPAPVQAVNMFGQPITLTHVKAPKERAGKGARHEGWSVVGISPQAHAEIQRKAALPGGDLAVLLRNADLERVTRKAYSSPSTAHEALLLAQRAGWVGLSVIEKKVE